MIAACIEVRHGRSARVGVPLAAVRDPRLPTWQEVSETRTSGRHSLTIGDDRNALAALDPPTTVQLALGSRRSVKVHGMRLATPGGRGCRMASRRLTRRMARVPQSD